MSFTPDESLSEVSISCFNFCSTAISYLIFLLSSVRWVLSSVIE
jgi:hypothetical protein